MASELCVILISGTFLDKIGGGKEHSDRGNSRCKDPEVCKSGSPEKQNQYDVCIEREYHFKELTHVVVEANKSKICMMGQQAKGPGRATT